MSQCRLFFSAIFSVLFLVCINAHAQVDTLTIVTPVPAPKEAVIVPQGYISCFTVGAGWYKEVWYPEHRICTYDPDKVQAAQGNAWIEGYWACTKYLTAERLQGQCTNWDWKPGHWVKSLPIY